MLGPLFGQSVRTTDLGTLPGKTYSVATGINDRGQVVGYSWNLNQYGFRADTGAFLWDTGVMTDLGTLPGCSVSVANAINSSGQVVGYSCGPDGLGVHAFLWDKGLITDLGTLFVNGEQGSDSWASAINDSGQVVGTSTTSSKRGGPQRRDIFLWDKGAMTDLGGFRGLASNTATGINARGQVVGFATDPFFAAPTFGFILQNGVFTDLGNLGRVNYTAAYGINDSGQVVGVTTALTGPAPVFLWNKG